MSRSPSIAEFTPSSVQDNGRRGEPKPGCDCVQCFGYCFVDREQAERDVWARGKYSAHEIVLMTEASGRPLNLDPDGTRSYDTVRLTERRE